MIKISKQFVDKYNSGKPQLLWEFIVADLETPVSALLKLTNNKLNEALNNKRYVIYFIICPC